MSGPIRKLIGPAKNAIATLCGRSKRLHFCHLQIVTEDELRVEEVIARILKCFTFKKVQPLIYKRIIRLKKRSKRRRSTNE